MGAGYQTARPVFVDDKMMKLPWQLMGDVIMRKDEVIDSFHDKASALGDQININALDKDKKQAADLARKYDDMVGEASDEIWKNPLEFERHVGKLRNISRTISDDMETGKWAALEDRYAGHTASLKAAQEALKKEGYSEEYINKKLSRELSDADELQYDEQTGNYNKYSARDLTKMEDPMKFVEETLKGAVPDGSEVEYDKFSGMWIIKTGEKREEMSENDLAKIMNSAVKGKPELIAAIKDRSELGVSSFENMLDANGDIMDPAYIADYEVEDAEGNKSTQKGLAYTDNFLGHAVSAGVEKYGFIKTSSKEAYRVNPVQMMHAKAELDKNAKKEEEDRARDQTVITFTENIQSPAGPDYDTFAANSKGASTGITASRSQALDNYAKFMKNKGADFDITDTEHPAYIAIMQEGDFSVLEDAGVSAYEINKLQSAHDRNQFAKNTLDGYRDTYMNNVEAEYNKAVQQGETADLNTWGVSNGYLRQEKNGVQVDKNQYSNFLSATYNNPVTREASWNWTGMAQKSIDRTKKEFESSYEMVEVNIPGYGNTTINKLVQSGVAQKKEVKVPYEKNLTSAEKAKVDRYNELLSKPSLAFDPGNDIDEEEEFDRLEKLSYIKKPDAISYTVKTGTGYVNLEVDPKSLIPVAGMGNDGQVGMKFKMSLDGNPIVGSVSTNHFSTESINDIKSINNSDMKVKLWLERNANADNIKTIPGFTIDVKNNFLRSGTGQKIEIRDVNGNITNEARPFLLSIAPNI